MKQTSSLPLSGTVRLYHGTSERFERFSLDFAARPGMSGNGNLGVWLAAPRDLAERFGKVCLNVDVEVAKPYIMPLQELSRLNEKVRQMARELVDDAELAAAERSFYTALRAELLVQGHDIIYLQELDGRIDMVISLLPAKLTIQ